MFDAKILRFYLDPEPLDRARKGKFNFVNLIARTLQGQGYKVEYTSNSDQERLKSAARPGYSMFLMDDPFHSRSLTMRRSYFYPFWRIEASAKRWNFEVAKRRFKPSEVDPYVARDWCDKWRKWLFKGAAQSVTYNGPIYVPLQGRLTLHRSFQAASPIEMLEQVVAHFPDTPVLASLHPTQTYSPAELEALYVLASRHSQVTVVTGEMHKALKQCRFVVSQNSSAALYGYFFHKPAVLFSQIDFHHISANVHEHGAQTAFEKVQSLKPEYDRFLYWFTMQNAIAADAPDAQQQVARVLKRRGWQVDDCT